MEEIGLFTGTAVCLTNTTTQTHPVFQYINLIITIIVGLVSIAYTIYKWYKKAKEDGQITKEEIGDLVGDIKEELDKFKEDE